MGEFNRNVWAPWRMQYIDSLTDEAAGGCFLCRNYAAPEDDERNHVLRRSERTLVVLNRFPYNSGHLLVAPAAHEGQLEALPEDAAARDDAVDAGCEAGARSCAARPGVQHWY